MRLNQVFALCLVLLVTSVRGLQGQQQATPSPDTHAPVLSLDDAISVAMNNNRLVKNSVLEAEKHEFRLSTARSKRLPQFQVAVLAGELLQPFDFTFPAGSFGTFSGTGPIPANDAKIRTPATFTTFATGSIDQPLSQLYKLHLGIKATELGREIAREDVRGERQKIASEVRKAYFTLIATQAEVDAAREAVKTLEEAQRITAQHQLQEAVLRADVLEVDARLAKSRYDLSVAENELATQREHLNQLLGRDLLTLFRVEPMPEQGASDVALDVARQRAFQNRPEIRQARLKEQQAEYDRRIAKADYIPDVNLSVRYMGFNNYQVLPSNVAVAGVSLTWEPFDWGRRRDKVKEKQKNVDQARNGAQETESLIAVEVGAKFRQWHDATLLLNATRTGHEAAAEQFRVTTSKYKEEAVLIRDVLQAQARSTEREFQYQQALSSYWSALADLRRAMGDE